jgi:hypothetical protein
MYSDGRSSEKVSVWISARFVDSMRLQLGESLAGKGGGVRGKTCNQCRVQRCLYNGRRASKQRCVTTKSIERDHLHRWITDTVDFDRRESSCALQQPLWNYDAITGIQAQSLTDCVSISHMRNLTNLSLYKELDTETRLSIGQNRW